MQSSGVTGSAGAGPNVSPAGFASPKLRVPGSCLAQGMRSRESALGVWHREVIKDDDRASRWFHQIFPVRYRPRVSSFGCFFLHLLPVHNPASCPCSGLATACLWSALLDLLCIALGHGPALSLPGFVLLRTCSCPDLPGFVLS